MYSLFNGDCLDVMGSLADDGVKVDLVLTDPPYGVTQFEWDNVLDYSKMWKCLNEITYNTSPICLFGLNPFIAEVILSNKKNFKYDWVWEKSNPPNFAVGGKYQPMKYHEHIAVFYKKFGKYYDQKIPRESPRIKQAQANNWTASNGNNRQGGSIIKDYKFSAFDYDKDYKKASSIIKSPSLKGNSKEKVRWKDYGLPPVTQKPVKLLKYLIKTYTDEGDTVLDFTMGSGSTGVACGNLNRNFIGIELDKEYYQIAEKRIKEAYNQKKVQ